MGYPTDWRIGTYTNTYATIGSDSTAVVVANPSRMHLVLVNDSTQTMYLGLGAAAVIGSGIRLNASGGSFEISETNLYCGAINAITASGQANITIAEGVK